MAAIADWKKAINNLDIMPWVPKRFQRSTRSIPSALRTSRIRSLWRSGCHACTTVPNTPSLLLRFPTTFWLPILEGLDHLQMAYHGPGLKRQRLGKCKTKVFLAVHSRSSFSQMPSQEINDVESLRPRKAKATGGSNEHHLRPCQQTLVLSRCWQRPQEFVGHWFAHLMRKTTPTFKQQETSTMKHWLAHIYWKWGATKATSVVGTCRVKQEQTFPLATWILKGHTNT